MAGHVVVVGRRERATRNRVGHAPSAMSLTVRGQSVSPRLTGDAASRRGLPRVSTRGAQRAVAAAFCSCLNARTLSRLAGSTTSATERYEPSSA